MTECTCLFDAPNVTKDSYDVSDCNFCKNQYALRMQKTLTNQAVLITGGSRGIGKAIAIRLAQMGANILINFVRNEDAAIKTADEIRKLGARAEIFQGNAGDPKDIDLMIHKTIETFGRLDILIHNAALGAFKPVHKLKMNQWELSMDINAKALLLLTQKALPQMEKQGSGNILTISSLGSQRYIPNYGAIGISKSAVESLVRYLAVELASKNIRVNCISGGLVDTDAVKSFPQYDEFRNEVITRTPTGRIGEPDDIARVAAFLASPESSWIVGQTIVADGGLSLI